MQIASTAFEDAAGNTYTGISDKATYNFTTSNPPDTTAPTVTINAPTKTSVGNITDTTFTITDDQDVRPENIFIDGASTAMYTFSNAHDCVQTSATQVDCTVVLTSSGDLTIFASDDAGNGPTSTTELGYTVLPDSDGDGVSDATEDAAPNGGDADGDGTQDSLQDEVSSTPNIVAGGGAYTTLKTDTTASSCDVIASLEHKSETDVLEDPNQEFPVGLWDFDITCTTPGDTADIKIYLDKTYDTTTWIYNKFQSNTYIDIASIVTYTTENTGGTDVTVINYQLTDGGLYDDDGLANGVIIDPAVLVLLHQKSPSIKPLDK